LKTTILPAAELSEDLCARWRAIQADNIDLANPFFAPEFTKAVAAVRPETKVAVIEDAGIIQAFLPYHPGKLGFGQPVGEILSDYHGLVAPAEFDMPPKLLLCQTGLVAWDFNHAPATQRVLRPGMKLPSSSPIIDLSAGYAAYLDAHRSAKNELMRKYRRLEREVGPVRFVDRSEDKGLLEMCLNLKSRQYVRTGVRDIFVTPWMRDLIFALQNTRSDGLTGILSILFAGDKVVSLHFGMRSATVWHWWFPAYDTAYAKYSPGVLLLLKMAETCKETGVTSIDLGQGNAHYKMRLSNGSHPLMVGSIERASAQVVARTGIHSLRKIVRESPLGPIWRAGKESWKKNKIRRNKAQTA